MVAGERLEILHDHYKESFALIREREKLRDRNFLLLLGLYALLIVEIGYPTEFGGTVGTVSVASSELDLSALPQASLLSLTWVFTAVLALRYCQVSIAVERSYDYLHHLEDTISPLLGGNGVYRREGQFYLNNYPPLLNLTWIAYGYALPAVITIATVALLVVEWCQLNYALPHKLLDAFMGLSIIVSLGSYRVVPMTMRQWARFKAWVDRRNENQEE